jgi:hypothetical protein
MKTSTFDAFLYKRKVIFREEHAAGNNRQGDRKFTIGEARQEAT